MTSACNSTAKAVTAMKILSRVCLVIGLTSSLVGRADPLFLLADNVASAIHPLASLFSSALGGLARLLTTLFRFGANYVANFIAGAWGIEHADYCSDSETSQKPQETAAVTISHNYLLKSFSTLCSFQGW